MDTQKINKLDKRVSYKDTDQMGMVYYANYLVFFERGRTELLREIGFAYAGLEKQGLYFPVIYADCKYLAPAKYDDMIMIETMISELGNASLTFKYNVKCNDKLLVTGSTKHPLVNKDFKPVRFPENLKSLLSRYVNKNG